MRAEVGEGGLRKGTSEDGTCAWTERGKEGRKRAGRGARKERGRKEDRREGNFKGGALRRTLASNV